MAKAETKKVTRINRNVAANRALREAPDRSTLTELAARAVARRLRIDRRAALQNRQGLADGRVRVTIIPRIPICPARIVGVFPPRADRRF